MKKNSKSQQMKDILANVARPEEHIAKLIHMACKHRAPTTISKKRNIYLTQNSERQCLILLSGSVALCRISDGMVLNAEYAPFIFGANAQLSYSPHLYIKAKETTCLLLIPQNIFYNEVTENGLWQSLAMLQDYTAAKVYAHFMMISQLSAYEIIRCHLIELMNEPDVLKKNITAANYIMEHSLLSRSGVMRILSKLKNEGYIHLSRGILTDIVNLPEKLNMFYAKPASSSAVESTE